MNAIFNYHATFPVAIDDETVDQKYVSLLRDLCKVYQVQFERGASGNYHYQAQFSLKIKTRMLTLANHIRKKYHVEVHLSPTANEHAEYCVKSESRIRGPWSNSDPPPVWQNPRLANVPIENWMQEIYDRKGEYEHREIHFIYDPNGNIGKSTCIDIGVQRHGFMEIFPLNSFKEMSQFLHSMLTQMGMPRVLPTLFINIPRTMNHAKLADFYSGIESIKDGKCIETRYEAKVHSFERPQMWVFSNSLPNPSYLTPDRWVWHRVVGGELNTCTFDEIAGDVPIHRPEAKRKRE